MVGGAPALRLRGIGKSFGESRVLEDVSLEVAPGEVVGLVGENGAGKSTLMRILFGMPIIRETGGYQGSVEVAGQEVRFRSPFDALDAGIGMVHQEFSLLPGFTAAENILLNREPLRRSALDEVFGERLSLLDRAAMEARARRSIERLGVPLDPAMLVKEMPVGHRQFTEIARELGREGLRLLVLDEPTAVLTESEAATLLGRLRALAAEGVAMIFISHRLGEVLSLCQRVAVLRDGRLVQDLPAGRTSVRGLAAAMVGREMAAATGAEPRTFPAGEPLLEVEGLWVDMPGETVRDATFSVARGEILGIGGLAGQGKLGIPNGLMGLHPAGGRVRYRGRPLPLGEPRAALEAGLAFVSEDRRGVGLLLDEGIDWNVAFGAMQVQGACLRPLLGGLLQWRSDAAMASLAAGYVKELEIRCTGVRQKAGTLSGGNQQKVCLARAFALSPELLLVAEPTRGIDVGAKELVLAALRRLNRERGTTIVVVSSELHELRSLCDRIAIVYEGRIAGHLPASAALEELGLLMAGAATAPPPEAR
ncbi:MAG: sugar ABC transporter ATP-binding protein [Deltaproteobacteria bacterium]|nr:sugar ABC transporter ATP-binding protein [Deltaproteobacteria bacterium]